MKNEALTKAAKGLLYLYQRTFWYVSLAKNEALKPLGFWNETLLILTFLAVNNSRPSWPTILIAYLAILFAAAIIGKLIVVMGIVKYNAKIANHQNPELMEILGEIKELKADVKRLKNYPASDATTMLHIPTHNHGSWCDNGKTCNENTP